MLQIIIPDYRTASRNKTATAHWRKYQEQKKYIADLIAAYAKNNKPITPARVIIEAYYEKTRSIDTSNIDDKIIVDGLMKIGVLPDDDALHNPEVIKRCFINTGKNELRIIIEQM
jgi:hypothetical protein